METELKPTNGKNGESVTIRSDWERNHISIQSAYVTLFGELKRAPSLQEIADFCHLSRNCIWEHCKKLNLEDFRPSAKLHADRVIIGIINAASHGDAACAKLYFQLIFGWKETSKIEGEINVTHDARKQLADKIAHLAAAVEETGSPERN